MNKCHAFPRLCPTRLSARPSPNTALIITNQQLQRVMIHLWPSLVPTQWSMRPGENPGERSILSVRQCRATKLPLLQFPHRELLTTHRGLREHRAFYRPDSLLFQILKLSRGPELGENSSVLRRLSLCPVGPTTSPPRPLLAFAP